MRVGDLEVVPVIDGGGIAPATKIFAGAPGAVQLGARLSDWAPHRAFLTPDADLEVPTGSFLVRSADRVVLVDLGIGTVDADAPSPFFTWHGGALLENLAAEGVRPDEVTDVVFTHLHHDHVGWASVDGVATFTRARLHVARRDWEWFMGPGAPGHDERVTRRLGPVAERVELFASDGELLPGVSTLAAPGHTPGSTVVVLSSGTERAMLLGDAVHCPVELLESEWGQIAEVDPALARRTRAALVAELEHSEIPVAAAHFPGMAFGRLLRGEGRRHWVL